MASLAKHQVRIGGMQCSFCSSSIARALQTTPGVADVHVSLAHEEALVEYDPKVVGVPEIEETLRSLGYAVRDPRKLRSFEEEDREMRREFRRLLASGAVTLAALAVMAFSWLGGPRRLGLSGADAAATGAMMELVLLYLAILNVFVLGFPILRMAYHSLRRGILNQHVLMEFAVFGGLAGGTAGFALPNFPGPDFLAIAAFITSYHLLGGYTSLKVRTRASQSVRKLLALQPAEARVVRAGREEIVPVEQVVSGDLVRIKPGESLPVDGVVVEGRSSVDESLVTGEPMPAEKGPGSEVIGGSVNRAGSLLVRVTRVGEESFLRRVARYIEEARAMKPGVLQLLDVVLRYFVPGVLAAAGVGFLTWTVGGWLVLGQPDVARGAFAALAALVMGYPCALGMATPLAMIRGGGLAAEKGILFRSSEPFHVFGRVDIVVLDKTGTVTVGRPRVTDVLPTEGHTDAELLSAAASVESLSEHPLAEAVVDAAKSRRLDVPLAENFEAVPGLGVSGQVEGLPVLAGKAEFLQAHGVPTEALANARARLERTGRTVVYVARAGRLVGLIGLADPVKGDAAETIAKLRESGMEPILLTGDNEGAARSVAEAVGVSRIYARVLPDQKAERIRELQREGHRVVMVGDGINDAPALMQADIGIALGAGADIAMESADVIIVGERLSSVVDADRIARASYRKTKENLALAFAFNGVGVPAAVTGLVHPAWAMAAMAASVSLVLLNSFGGRILPRPRGRERPARVVLEVPSLHCSNCLAGVMASVSALPEVASVEGDLARKEVFVTYRGGRDAEERIREKVLKAGHVIGN